MTLQFRPDFAITVCGHVFRKSRPVLFVVRDEQFSWQFLCGIDGYTEENDCHLVGVGHLLDIDSSLSSAADLGINEYQERLNQSSSWSRGTLT